MPGNIRLGMRTLLRWGMSSCWVEYCVGVLSSRLGFGILRAVGCEVRGGWVEGESLIGAKREGTHHRSPHRLVNLLPSIRLAFPLARAARILKKYSK